VKTTKKNFELFIKECKKWIQLLGVTSWRIVIEHKDREDHRDLSWCCIESSTMSCSVMLSVNWYDNKISNNAIKRCAFHEICHVMLSPIDDMLTERGYGQDEVDKVLHGLIYVFENCLFGMEK